MAKSLSITFISGEKVTFIIYYQYEKNIKNAIEGVGLQAKNQSWFRNNKSGLGFGVATASIIRDFNTIVHFN